MTVLVSLLAVSTTAADTKSKSIAEWVELVRSNPRPSIEAMAQNGESAQSLIPSVLAAMKEEIYSPFSPFFTELGASAIPALELALKSADAPTRRRAAIALGYALAKEPLAGLNVLRGALSDSDAGVRKFAAYSMGAAGTHAAPFASELKTLLTDSDADVQLAAGTALMLSGSAKEETLTALLAPFSKATQHFRYAALSALINSNYCVLAEQSIPLLRLAMADEVLRFDALIGVEKVGPLARVMLPEIEALMSSQNRGERQMALRALQSIKQTVPPDLQFLATRAMLALKRGDARKQARFISRRYQNDPNEMPVLDMDFDRNWDRAWGSIAQDTIGTVDHAMISRRGLLMEFVREDGAWKLLRVSFSMC